MIGTKLAHYDITSHLGTGGMGEVYQASDSKLGRSVAIKFLPEAFSHDTERVARFQREARMLASLNHSNNAAIYGVEETDNRHFLVMELVAGETLADRIKRGPIPMEEALPIAKQIAEALEEAHEKGIIHRDLKPANIKLTPDGKVKVLDFGLAKAYESDQANVALSHSPTISMAATNAGVILGTAAYMSPEQARGRAVDKRTDIWALGCVLYEMLTGKPAFRGDDVTEILASVVKSEPDWSLLPAATPAPIRRLLRRCLEKDRRRRLESAADARLEIEDALTAPAASTPRKRSNGLALLVIALAVAGAVVTVVFFSLRPVSETPLWFAVIPPESNFSPTPAGAISPDGKSIAFNGSGASTLWVRSFESSDARELPGTAGGLGTPPFWSPDGRSIGFFANGKLQRVSIDGGAPQFLAQAPNPRGASWGIDGTIIFAPAPGGLFKISASGGTATPLRVPDPSKHDIQFMYPHFLPDGKHFLYWSGNTDPQREGLYAGSLDLEDTKRIADVPSRAEYADGYLLYGRGGDLFARPFDVSRLEMTGQERRIAGGLGWMYGDIQNRAFSTSPTGMLAYSSQSFQQTSQLVWFERSGRRLESASNPGEFFGFVAAPDRKRAVLERAEGTLWLLEFSTGIASPLSTEKGVTFTPIWAPDSERVAYSIEGKSPETINPISGKKEAIPFSREAIAGAFLQSWSPDGRFLVWSKSSEGQSDLWIASADGKSKAAPFIQSPSNEFRAEISPDGHWIAYVSNESGRDEVIVESFPQPGQKKRISAEGGNFPSWRPDGHELYYLEPSAAQRSKLMTVRVDASSNTFMASRPELLFETPPLSNNPRRGQYAAFGAGDRFLMNVLVEDSKPRAITVILNWPALLKQK